MFRVGFGNDIHRLIAGRPLIIGGVPIESELGADGHSDADVLLHALTDALLGALALGDIGTHFPNNDERWHNAESSVFLRYALGLIKSRGYVVANVDSTVSLEKTKLRLYVDAMRENISNVLELEITQVSVKAKTSEKLDAVGEGLAVRAEAIVLLSQA
jgi:2-C-methyl-D-erythritol 2,4-cyclodiphosphate synthase